MKVLQKKQNADFKILNLTDPQLVDPDWREDKAIRRELYDTVTYLVDKTSPDLITVSGDLSCAENYKSYENLADLLSGFCVPWSFVFGNHDSQDGHEAVLRAAEILTSRPGCVFEAGPEELGCGNFVIGIEEDGRLLHGVIMMDSHDRMSFTDENGKEKRVWAELYPGQFTWYGDRIRELEALGAKESSIIMHIPIYTYRDAIRAALKADIDPKSVSTALGEQTGCWNEGYEDSFGVMLERICSYPRDNGFFEEILKYGNTKNLICGHDHTNNFSVVYRGVRFTYALKTGSGCYWDPRLSGGTVLSVDSNGKMLVDHCFYSTKE